MRLKILSPFLNNGFMKLISSLEGNTPKQGNHQGKYERCFGKKREFRAKWPAPSTEGMHRHDHSDQGSNLGQV